MATADEAREMRETLRQNPSHDHRQASAPGPGETEEQHQAHLNYKPIKHWGLGRRTECVVFYIFTIPSWCFEIAACVVGSFLGTASSSFIACCTIWLVCWAAAWLQTAVAMVQRASWTRDEANLKDRKQYLFLAVRLNRLMLPTAIPALVTFIVGYAERDSRHDLPYWLIFLLFFIFNTVGCVMNAYNNITWECDRLHYEEGFPAMKYTRLAIFGIPSSDRGLFRFD